ncbi:ABC transporter substrate-binding protein [Anaerosinus massiliensis]|uniref:ABC transporter substrate-binding protein n=1 Tax=Massilibacillus massiliensis TaxID=1806837 RepID=UPI000DA63F82|nr:ABC transporter substrate-binding protein [Massilibacillus massiliensis]
MLKLKQICMFLLLVVCAVNVAACSNAEKDSANQEESVYLTIKDDLDRTVNLTHKPEKIIALSPSFLELLGAVDAKLIARPSSKNSIPVSAQDLEEVGAVYNINIEKVISLQPDLVIAYEGMHDKFLPILETNHIPVIVLKMKTYQDVLDKINLFSQISGETQKGKALMQSMNQKVQNVTDKIPKEAKKIAILHSTAKSVTVELEGSIAGTAAKTLGFHNIASGSKALEQDPDSTPYSLEKLVENDPEIIFIVTMGKLEDIRKRMLSDIESNPAWSSLNAVKKNKVYFLPQDLFLLNPGLRYPEAIELMAKLVYPEVLNDGR